MPTIHEDAGGNLMWHGLYEWGDLDAAFAEADKIVKIDELHFHRFNSTPLECDGALVEYNRGMGQWTITTNNQFPGFAIIMMGPAMRTGLDKLRFVTQDIGGGFGNKITSHPQLVACCLLARKLNRPDPVDRVAHRLPPLDVARQRALVPGDRGRRQERRHAARLPDEGARRRRRLPALRAARRRHLGPGHARDVQVEEHPRRLHAGRDEQGSGVAEPRLLADAAPLVHGAHHRHRRARARPRPGRGPETQLRARRGHAVHDAERLRLRLGRLRADARHRARPGRLSERRRSGGPRPRREASCWASVSARRSTPAPTTSASRE